MYSAFNPKWKVLDHLDVLNSQARTMMYKMDKLGDQLFKYRMHGNLQDGI